MLKAVWIVGVLLGSFFGMSVVQTIDSPYCLCTWEKDEVVKTIGGDTKYTCIGYQNSVLDKEGSEFNFITQADLEGGAFTCDAIPFVVLKEKKVVSLKSLTCKKYNNKQQCMQVRSDFIAADDSKKSACFCTSSDGTNSAKCEPDDGQSCKSYIDETYGVCTLKPSDECIEGVASAAAALKVNPSAGETNVQVSALAQKEFNRIGTTDIKIVFGRAIRVAMGIMGSLALAMFVYAGFLMMLSPGNSDHMEKARNILIWSSLGLVVILASYALVNLILTTL